MNKKICNSIIIFAFILFLTPLNVFASEDEITLRVCNCEEYIDLGEWDESEVIDLDSGDIFSENSLMDDFEDWYYETYGKKVNVEYSTYGTNEDLYNMLTIGDEYDLICTSEYMIMKLMTEDRLVPLSQDFFDNDDENNYYIKGLSPYVSNVFNSKENNGHKWSEYMAGYMWGVTGIVYNPNMISDEDASTWQIIANTDYRRQVSVKNDIRDSYFAALGAVKSDLLTSEDFINDPDYAKNLEREMNDTSDETIAKVQEYLKTTKDIAYSFETDSGKSDMITGKVLANYQWSGDAVYVMDQADEDDYTLNFAIPKECTNVFFDGWSMLKVGIGDDAEKQKAAEAFINFISRPDSVVRNMYYIGYTSVISGGDDDTIFDYIEWNYGAEDDDEDTLEDDLSYFFSDHGEDSKYILTASTDQINRQLFAQYPSSETLDRACIMLYFNDDANAKINKMWINVRCYSILDVPVYIWIIAIILVLLIIVIFLRRGKFNTLKM